MRGEDLMEAMGGLDEALLEKANSYRAEKRSGFSWTRYLGMAACIMLLVGLAVINMSLANVNSALADGDRTKQLEDGNVYKVKTLDKEDVIVNYSELVKRGKTSLYVLAVTGGDRFDAICTEINSVKEEAWPDLYEEMNLSYAIPILRFAGREEFVTEYMFPQVKEGKIVSFLFPRVDVQTEAPLSIGLLGGGDELYADSDGKLGIGPGGGTALRWLAPLTSKENPLMIVDVEGYDLGFVPRFYIIGDIAYCATDYSELGFPPAFQNYTPEIDWQRVEEYGWELEVIGIELY